ncbi:PREDICTED: uncharacterized protein LOC108773521 [Cyphomyrmex costatus]|uniref:uncharacterized protein LOC108773521 n=1 Tax=Cyphomyrmex costatus TaxID=456900 RepID=UPI0008521FEE|nr:PREDICTED: uncharacterized protein LOC108773521 [Cyphomyrmex costatus]
MDTLYPNLYERFKTEGLCPICFMEMELMPRYSCINGHTVCYRCKPYYYNCFTCAAPLDVEILSPQQDVSQSVHLMPHPMPSHRYDDYNPSAQSMNDFLDHERRPWEAPSVPSENQRFESCSYSHLGCWVKIPEHLRVLHESRCQFRPHLEQQHMPTDLHHSHDDLVDCSYSAAGCRVRTVPWRRSIHEQYCIYKTKNMFQSVNDMNDDFASATISDNDYGGDPEELVQCKFKQYGCMVNIPRRRKYIHEQKCHYKNHEGDVFQNTNDMSDGFASLTIADNDYSGDPEELVQCKFNRYGCTVNIPRRRKYIHEQKCNYKSHQGDLDGFDYPAQLELDPDEQVECKWSEYGCRVRPKRSRKQIHEDKCNYRKESPSMRYI